MAKATVNILCPSGHRRKAQVTPNGNLLQVLEDMCIQEDLDSSEWGLMHLRTKCDLALPWRLSSIPTNALLEMYKLEERRPATNVTIQLLLPDGSRQNGSFNPSTSLHEMLDWYRSQSASAVVVLDSSINDANPMHPVCSYMSEEIIGAYALSNTTLRELGLTNGTAIIRYHHRSMKDEELKLVNDRIDEKIARRKRQQERKQEPPVVAKPPLNEPSLPRFEPTPAPILTTTTSFDTEQYSIFRDVHKTQPTTSAQQRPKTLAEELGIHVSLDTSSIIKQSPQTNFSNFKFPEATKGRDLQKDDASNTLQRDCQSKSCDRHAMAYDLASNSARSESESEEVPDSFYELTPDDLRSILNSLKQQSSDESPLETRLMRERNALARANSYKCIAIRLVVNSNHILQGLFFPNEPLSSLAEFVRANVVFPQIERADFYLYTSPPRTVLSDFNKPLSSFELAPASYVYIGHRTVSPLVGQLKPDVSIGTINDANRLVARYVFDDANSINTDGTLTSESNVSNSSMKRTTPASNVDDKQLKEKFRKFLPGSK